MEAREKRAAADAARASGPQSIATPMSYQPSSPLHPALSNIIVLLGVAAFVFAVKYVVGVSSAPNE